LLGLLAAVGIVHGKPFAPNERMRKILEEAAAVGNATARTVTFAARPEEGFAFYPDSEWQSALFVGGYQFLDPPPLITADGAVPYQPGAGSDAQLAPSPAEAVDSDCDVDAVRRRGRPGSSTAVRPAAVHAICMMRRLRLPGSISEEGTRESRRDRRCE
jgi:hypothetical protein